LTGICLNDFPIQFSPVYNVLFQTLKTPIKKNKIKKDETNYQRITSFETTRREHADVSTSGVVVKELSISRNCDA
jgi:hypothetical protein